MLYPYYSPNNLQFGNLNLQSQVSSTDDTDETNETTDELTEEDDGEGDENGDSNGDGDSDGDEDGDEDVGEEMYTDLWQSIIDYFGICEGSNKPFRIAVFPRLPIKAN